MNEKINYQNWPERVKIVTALSNKNLLIKNYKIPMILGYMVLIMGFLDLIYKVAQNYILGVTDLLYPLSFVLIGLVNIVNSKSIKWIANNSSWEERFENNSTTMHKLISATLLVVLLICLYLIITKSNSSNLG